MGGAVSLVCWKCGADLKEILVPLSRDAQCQICEADLHVCYMCRFFEKSKYNQCREPLAEQVRDKDKSNFCDYLKLRENAYDAVAKGVSDQARDNLEDIFSGLSSENESEKKSIEDLFK